MPLHLNEELAFTTVRLEGALRGGGVSTGTGFFYRTEVDADRWAPAIITNKHVLADVDVLTFQVCLVDAAGQPVVGRYFSLNITDIQSSVILHPSAEIDLCAVPCAGIVQLAADKGAQIFIKYFKHDHIPTAEEEADFGALEPILMVGYPNGLWDRVNNRPLLRRGVTYTHPSLDLNGKGEFMIDAACFPGSSGSPVILWREPGYIDRHGTINMAGINPKLLGALYAGPVSTVEGEVTVTPVPTAQGQLARIGIPMNLGLVVKSRYIRDLEPLIIAVATRTA